MWAKAHLPIILGLQPAQLYVQPPSPLSAALLLRELEAIIPLKQRMQISFPIFIVFDDPWYLATSFQRASQTSIHRSYPNRVPERSIRGRGTWLRPAFRVTVARTPAMMQCSCWIWHCCLLPSSGNLFVACEPSQKWCSNPIHLPPRARGGWSGCQRARGGGRGGAAAGEVADGRGDDRGGGVRISGCRVFQWPPILEEEIGGGPAVVVVRPTAEARQHGSAAGRPGPDNRWAVARARGEEKAAVMNGQRGGGNGGGRWRRRRRSRGRGAGGRGGLLRQLRAS